MKRPDGRTVAVVTPYYPPHIGGVEQYAERLAKALRTTPDLRPVVITVGSTRRTVHEVRDGVPVVALPRLLTLSNTPMPPFWPRVLGRLLRPLSVDIGTTHAPVPVLADVAAAVAGRRPVVVNYHAGSMAKGSGAVDVIIRGYERHVLPRTFRRADALIAVSRTSLAYQVPGARLISPGVDIEEFRPAGHPWGTTVLYVGRLDRSSAWKGVEVLIRSFAAVHAARPAARLRIVGSGDAVPEHRRHAHALGIADAVSFSGALRGSELRGAYARARVLVLPSLTDAESFGMTLVEAMATGRPVIGSAVGGIPDVVTEGETGLLVPPGDATALAAACTRLLDSDALCARLGAAGRRVAETRYAWPLLVDEHIAILRALPLSHARADRPERRPRSPGPGSEPSPHASVIRMRSPTTLAFRPARCRRSTPR